METNSVDNKNVAKKRIGCSRIFDTFMLVINAIFLGLIVYGCTNGVYPLMMSLAGWSFSVSVIVTTGVAAIRLKYLKAKKASTKCQVITVLLYIVNLMVVIPFLSILLLLGMFHDEKFENPKRYSNEMFYGEIRKIAPEEIPINATNVDFYYQVSNVAEYRETFLQYSLPQTEYTELKERVLEENKSSIQSKFFKGYYDVDVDNKDRDGTSRYSYDFVSFCDTECMVRFVYAYSPIRTEPYFKSVDGMTEKE